jgi:hypothetical protein
VVTHDPDRAIAVVDDTLVKSLGRHLAHVALYRAQYGDPPRDEFRGRQRRVPGALEPDEFGDILEVLAEYVLVAFGDNRHVAHAEREQSLASSRIVQDVDRIELDALARKKLFRPETGASAGLGEEQEFVGDATHDFLPMKNYDYKSTKATPRFEPASSCTAAARLVSIPSGLNHPSFFIGIVSGGQRPSFSLESRLRFVPLDSMIPPPRQTWLS